MNGRTVAEDMAARHLERNGEPPEWPCQFCGKFIDCCSCHFRASDAFVRFGIARRPLGVTDCGR